MKHAMKNTDFKLDFGRDCTFLCFFQFFFDFFDFFQFFRFFRFFSIFFDFFIFFQIFFQFFFSYSQSFQRKTLFLTLFIITDLHKIFVQIHRPSIRIRRCFDTSPFYMCVRQPIFNCICFKCPPEPGVRLDCFGLLL